MLKPRAREARRGAFSRALLRFAGESPLFLPAALSGPAVALRAQSQAPAALLLPRSSKRPRHASGPAAGNTPPVARFAFRTLATAARQFLPSRPAAAPAPGQARSARPAVACTRAAGAEHPGTAPAPRSVETRQTRNRANNPAVRCVP